MQSRMRAACMAGIKRALGSCPQAAAACAPPQRHLAPGALYGPRTSTGVAQRRCLARCTAGDVPAANPPKASSKARLGELPSISTASPYGPLEAGRAPT